MNRPPRIMPPGMVPPGGAPHTAQAPNVLQRPHPWRPGLPDAAPGLPEPRLPGLGGSRPYEPPLAPVVPAQLPTTGPIGKDFESWTSPPLLIDPVVGTAQLVYRTQRKWKQCDVLIDPQTLLTNGTNAFLRVVIYGYVAGVRTLVGQGAIDVFTSFETVAGAQRAVPILVASCNADVESFEVWVESELDASSLNGTYNTVVTVMASNVVNGEAQAQDTVNLAQFVAPGPVATITTLASVEQCRGVGLTGAPLFLRGLQGVNTNAAARYLQVFDTGQVQPVAPADVPILSFLATPVGTAGAEIRVDDSTLTILRTLRFRRGPWVAISSTPATYTAAAGVSFVGFVR